MNKSFFLTKAAALLLSVLLLAGCSNGNDSSSVTSTSSVGADLSSGQQTSSSEGEPDSSSAIPEVPEMPELPEIPEDKTPKYVSWMLEEKVHEIRITMSDEDWTGMCNLPYSGDYYPANVTIDGQAVENVGVRTRGHASLYTAVELYPDSHKYPLKIKFDKYNKDQTFLGLDELALNNGGDDFSFMRDYMGYEAYRLMENDASCVTFFNVYINDELRGFYVGVESIDSSYLERMFGSHKKNLYEGEDGASLSKYMPLSYLTQKKGKDETKSDVKNLIDVIDKMPLGEKGDIESVLDVESALRMLAVNAVLDNRDGYGGIFAHNYYLYNNGGKFVMLPWDMNAPFVSYATDIEAPTVGVYGYSQMNDRPLAKKLMAVDEYYQKYLGYCRQLTEKLPQLKENVLRIHAMIKESVENDPNKFCSSSYFNSYYSENNSYSTVRFLTKRYDYLIKRLEQLEGKPISEAALNPPPPPPEESEEQTESGSSESTEATEPAENKGDTPATPEQAEQTGQNEQTNETEQEPAQTESAAEQ